MGDAIAAILGCVLVFGAAIFAAAWATVLPALGLFWLFGWLA